MIKILRIYRNSNTIFDSLMKLINKIILKTRLDFMVKTINRLKKIAKIKIQIHKVNKS